MSLQGTIYYWFNQCRNFSIKGVRVLGVEVDNERIIRMLKLKNRTFTNQNRKIVVDVINKDYSQFQTTLNPLSTFSFITVGILALPGGQTNTSYV
jgi:UDP-glucose 6-dehydrogenase